LNTLYHKEIKISIVLFFSIAATPKQPLLRFPKKSAALRFSLAFFDRFAIKTSLYLPQAALRFQPGTPPFSRGVRIACYKPKQSHPLL